MLNLRHESLFTRFAATSAASYRRWSQSGRGRTDLRDLGSQHQTLSASPTRNGPICLQAHSRAACPERSGATDPLANTTGGPSRCESRRALSPLPGRTRHPGFSCLHQSGQDGFGLDAKKKTLRAAEQNEAARAAWRKQAASLKSDDLVFVDETGSHISMTPLYAYAPTPDNAQSAKCHAIMEPR